MPHIILHIIFALSTSVTLPPNPESCVTEDHQWGALVCFVYDNTCGESLCWCEKLVCEEDLKCGSPPEGDHRLDLSMTLGCTPAAEIEGVLHCTAEPGNHLCGEGCEVEEMTLCTISRGNFIRCE